ncbi:MAG TPA: hypothetical protein DEG06_05395 [Lachnospiraceae bacterium]|jgi:hypothetical protein|nr:hypothetical protein [Lachnospiraceae bacterium]HCA69032.1 hypothetical protein [Lachnospiraceae bacterium]HCR41428.1 hypothetical protein [Lachnospiraceae bacterium]
MLQVVMEEKLDYLSFINTVCGKVKEALGEEYQVQICKVIKNNSLELDSLVVLKKGRNYAPNIYLLSYYESYLGGTPVPEIVGRLCMLYQSYEEPVLSRDFTYSLKEMKQCIIYRLVSFERNQKLLSQIPHIKYLDLAVTFHCVVRDDEEGIGTIRITNEHMKQWKTTTEELSSYAAKNTSRWFPASIRSMEETILGLLREEHEQSKEDVITEEWMEQRIANQRSEKKHTMYILTNQKGINGASCLLYSNLLFDFANNIQSDLYILPSSIHEVILVPSQKKIKKESLEQMVWEVNHTHVAPEEVLSDRVYYYSRENNSIRL